MSFAKCTIRKTRLKISGIMEYNRIWNTARYGILLCIRKRIPRVVFAILCVKFLNNVVECTAIWFELFLFLLPFPSYIINSHNDSCNYINRRELHLVYFKWIYHYPPAFFRMNAGDFKEMSRAVFAKQSHLTRININHSRFVRACSLARTRPLTRQFAIPQPTPGHHPSVLPSSDSRQRPITTSRQKFSIFELSSHGLSYLFE